MLLLIGDSCLLAASGCHLTSVQEKHSWARKATARLVRPVIVTALTVILILTVTVTMKQKRKMYDHATNSSVNLFALEKSMLKLRFLFFSETCVLLTF